MNNLIKVEKIVNKSQNKNSKKSMGYLGVVHTFYGKQSYLLRLLSSPGGTSIREGTFIYFRGIVQGVLLLGRVRLFGTIEYKKRIHPF